MRATLHTHWASIRKWYRYQPLDYIKEYFGVKIGKWYKNLIKKFFYRNVFTYIVGLYFAWLGFYTYMLLLASIVGVFCFLYSWITLDNHVPA